MLSTELIGLPADAKVLIINCDDFGMYPDINTATMESIERGIASSCSLMVAPPAAKSAIRLLRARPHIPFGIHLTMVCESPYPSWGPLSRPHHVSSLLDDHGRLFPPTAAGRATVLAQARLDEVEIEFRAQIDAVADEGLTPTHLDFHCLADGGRADILTMTERLAAEYGLAVRLWLDSGLEDARLRGLPVVDNGFLDSFSLDTHSKAQQYARLIAGLKPGLTEWAVHPSLAGPQSQCQDDGWRVRRSDYEFLISPTAAELILTEKITIIDYRTIQQIWARKNRNPVPNS